MSFLAVLTSMTLNDLELPKKSVLVFFCDFQLRCTLQGLIPTKWLKIDQDNLRTGTAKALERLMNFARMTCLVFFYYLFICRTYCVQRIRHTIVGALVYLRIS